MGAEAAEIMRKKQGVQKNNHPESALVKERAFEGWVTRQSVLVFLALV